MKYKVNKDTFQVYANVSDIDFPETEYLYTDTLPGCSQRYWKIENGSLLEMTQSEKDNVDLINPLTPPPISRVTVMKEILSLLEPETQLPRMLDAVDKYHSFTVALDGGNIPMARARMQKALTNGDIEQSDYDIVDGVLTNYE